MADDTENLEEEARFEIEPSELDDATHAESLILYRDSQDNIHLTKSLQWKTLGGALAIFALLGFCRIKWCHRGRPYEDTHRHFLGNICRRNLCNLYPAVLAEHRARKAEKNRR